MVHVTSLFLFASLLLNAASSSFALPLSARNNVGVDGVVARALPVGAIEPVFAREVDTLPTLKSRRNVQPAQDGESRPKRQHARDIYHVGPNAPCGNLPSSGNSTTTGDGAADPSTSTTSSVQARETPARSHARDIYYVGPNVACKMRPTSSESPSTDTGTGGVAPPSLASTDQPGTPGSSGYEAPASGANTTFTSGGGSTDGGNYQNSSSPSTTQSGPTVLQGGAVVPQNTGGPPGPSTFDPPGQSTNGTSYASGHPVVDPAPSSSTSNITSRSTIEFYES